MPRPIATLAPARARELLAGCVAPSGDQRVGVELEWLTLPSTGGAEPVDHDLVRETVERAGPLPADSRVTYEPGGQLELSSRPCPSPATACVSTARDLAAVRTALSAADIALAGVGLDPDRPPHRVVDLPRYRAMEAYFDAQGSAGRTMMCSTAGVQVNLDVGPEPTRRLRWELLHTLGPVLVAAFANSPIHAGRPSGWRSERAALWICLDPTRTAPVGSGEPADAWFRYAMSALVMQVVVGPDHHEVLLDGLTFGKWMADGHELGWPTEDDLLYHLSTLFPPVRPRGWFEVRVVDALPDPWWRVPVLLLGALLGDPSVARDALDATIDVASLRVDAARHGVAHPRLWAAATRCFDLALDHLDGDDSTVVSAYADRWTRRGRSPADDLLERWTVRNPEAVWN